MPIEEDRGQLSRTAETNDKPELDFTAKEPDPPSVRDSILDAVEEESEGDSGNEGERTQRDSRTAAEQPSQSKQYLARLARTGSPAQRQAIENYEKDIKFQEEYYKTVERFYDVTMECIKPYEDTIRRFGFTNAQVLQQLFGWMNALAANDPQVQINAFRALARNFNINLGNLDKVYIQHPTTYPDQQQKILNDRREQVRAWETKWKEFKSNPAHKHAERVRAKMGRLLMAGVTSTWDEAYRIAVSLDKSLSLAKPQQQPTVPRSPNKQLNGAAKPSRGPTVRDSIRQAVRSNQ